MMMIRMFVLLFGSYHHHHHRQNLSNISPPCLNLNILHTFSKSINSTHVDDDSNVMMINNSFHTFV